MSKTLQQIFTINPTTVVADTDLYYLVQSPYTPGTDAAITGASLKAAFGSGGTINPGLINQLAYYAAAGTTLSGLATLANGVLVTSAGSVPSISQTLPNAVQDNITRLGTIANIGSPLGGAFGGTGVNNGASAITIGGSLTFSGAFTFTGTLTNTTAVTFPTSGTLATTSQLPTPAALTKTDDTNVTLTLGGTPATALLQAVSLTLGWTGQLGLARGGTAASLTASNGGIVYSTASALAILAGTATAGQILRSGASTTPSWSTATFPATAGTSGNVLTSDGTNWTSAAPTGVTLLTTKGDLFGFSTVNARVPVATGNGKVLQVDSTASVGLSYSTPTYPSASATSGLFIVSDGTNFVPSVKAAFTTINIQTFATSGTYTPTSGMKYCIIECVGPGGAGGGAALSSGLGFGGGGGGGGYSRKFATAATIGASQTVTVGTGGTPGSAGNNPGGNGSGATSVGVICTAGAGSGGGGAAANTASAGGAGGTAGTGDIAVAGNGGSGGIGSGTASINAPCGLGGAGPWGGQAVPAGTTTTTGAAGNGPGTGGNGGGSAASSAAKAGGAGSNGIVVITEYIYA
jgi:hypothetical protein